eukprot:8654030-Pyramimonas_sp.AAC.1
MVCATGYKETHRTIRSNGDELACLSSRESGSRGRDMAPHDLPMGYSAQLAMYGAALPRAQQECARGSGGDDGEIPIQIFGAGRRQSRSRSRSAGTLSATVPMAGAKAADSQSQSLGSES